MHTNDVVGVNPAQLGGDERAPVAALCAIALVAEPAHELGPGPGDTRRGPAGVVGWAGEAVAGERRDDDIEGVGGVAAMGARVGQRPNHLQELDDRAWPAMREDQRQCARLGRAHVQEVDCRAIDGGGELRKCVEPGLPRAPVIRRAPVFGQLLEIRKRHAAAPANARQVIGPAGARQPLAQVVEISLRNVDAKRPDRGVAVPGAGLGCLRHLVLVGHCRGSLLSAK